MNVVRHEPWRHDGSPPLVHPTSMEATLPKPFVNLDEVAFTDIEENGYYTSKRAQFSAGLGARKLGYNLTELPPGKAQCPFHSHRAEEEMFLILEGEGELRYGAQRYRIRRHDVIACPAGDASTAHQIINTGSTTMRYLSLSNMSEIDVCEYPDSGKVGVHADHPKPGLHKMYRAESTVEYYDRESFATPGSDG